METICERNHREKLVTDKAYVENKRIVLVVFNIKFYVIC